MNTVIKGDMICFGTQIQFLPSVFISSCFIGLKSESGLLSTQNREQPLF